jgi:hypothetical protein
LISQLSDEEAGTPTHHSSVTYMNMPMSLSLPALIPLPPWPCVRIDGMAAGQLVLDVAAGRPVVLASVSGIAGLAGVGWWAALTEALHQENKAPFLTLLDVSDQTGQVLAALRAGVKTIAFRPPADMPHDGISRLLGLATAHGANLYGPPSCSIEPCWIRNRDAPLRQWLAQHIDTQGM